MYLVVIQYRVYRLPQKIYPGNNDLLRPVLPGRTNFHL